MHIGLNLLHALPEIGGGWNYIANVVSALGECDDVNTYLAFVTPISQCLVPSQPNFTKVLIKINSRSRPQRVLYENTLLQGMAYWHHLNCMHWFANVQAILNTVPAVVTIHDLQPVLNYADFSFIKRSYLRYMLAATVKRASMLLPVSQATANDLQHVLGSDPARVAVIPAILDMRFKPAAGDIVDAFRAKYRLPAKFWLYVAHMYPHKNHVRLLQAYHDLKVRGFKPWPLVLRGDPGGAEVVIRQTLKRLELERDVILLPRLEGSELPALYSAASALVFPSLYEGGGIPVIEALACGCPITASDIPSVREFAGDAASYFDPLNTDAIARAVLACQNDAEGHKIKQQAGLARAEEFRPRPVIRKLLQAYSRASAST